MAAAGHFHTVLLKNTGEAVAFGASSNGQCAVPALAAGERYVSCAAGGHHTVLLKNTGEAVAFGGQDDGRCDVPALAAGERYQHPLRTFVQCRVAQLARLTGEACLDAIVSAMAGAAFEEALVDCLLP